MIPKSPDTGHDITLTDLDPRTQMTRPGRYLSLDMVHGVAELIEVAQDLTQHVVETRPILSVIGDVEAMAPPCPVQGQAVGQLYAAPRTTWPEGMHARVSPDGIELALFWASPAAQEIAMLHTQPIEMRLLSDTHAMMFLLRFGRGYWQEAPYSVHRVPPGLRGAPPDPGPGYGWPLYVVLVDARTGIVQGLRMIALSRRFSCAVLHAFEKQVALPADDTLHIQQVHRMQRRSLESLAAAAMDRFVQGETAN